MAWILKGEGPLGRTVSKSETKACTLCGALNFVRNSECKTCGWRGAFEREGAAVDYCWQRLTECHEEVRIEHVVRGAMRGIDDFGRPRKVSAWQRLAATAAQGWQALLSPRATSRASQETLPRPKSALPPL